ncbi:hypothetical protein [Streptosporangium vulgare]|uniref:hypothetical protein n=1 Tax=Streptosporangium vulgare TaxID=46190 RepID=UPI0031D9CC9D
MTSYSSGKMNYLRRGAGFTRQAAYQEITVAPKGKQALAVPTSYQSGYDSVVLLDLATSKGTRIRTVKKPLVAHYAHWSRNGGKAVLTVERKSGSAWVTSGFVVVDAVAKTAKTVTVANVDNGREVPLELRRRRHRGRALGRHPSSTGRTARSAAPWSRPAGPPVGRTPSPPRDGA